ncbi:MAG TPA: hypothetical protein VKU41_27330, partial [Polyangiaceae bacterium]|nr:hypothetical protein [Polyangiaceae bacterium]
MSNSATIGLVSGTIAGIVSAVVVSGLSARARISSVAVAPTPESVTPVETATPVVGVRQANEIRDPIQVQTPPAASSSPEPPPDPEEDQQHRLARFRAANAVAVEMH